MYFLGQLCLIRTESRPLLRPVILCFLVCGTSLPSLQIMLDLFSIPATLRQLFSGVCITAHTRLLQSSFSHPAKRMATWLVVLIMFDSTGGSLAWAGGTLVILCCLLWNFYALVQWKQPCHVSEQESWTQWPWYIHRGCGAGIHLLHQLPGSLPVEEERETSET